MTHYQEDYEVESYIQTLISGKKRVHTILYKITKEVVHQYFNDINEEA